MGNLCSVEGAVDHWIYIKTGDRKGSGVDVNLKIALYDVNGQRSPDIGLNCRHQDDFERGQTDTFQCPSMPDLEDIVQIELWREDPGAKPDWFCDVIVVNNAPRDKSFYFPVQRWIQGDFHYMIPAYDTSLPQDCPYQQQRQLELDQKRAVYEFDQKAPGLPIQAKFLPPDEVFSDDSKWDLDKRKNDLLSASMLTRQGPIPWNNMIDLINMYDRGNSEGDPFPTPVCVDRWSKDIWFGAQRLVGCNPTAIKLCSSLPENMGVTAEMLRPFLEGWTVKQIIDAKRLFIVDHKILHDLPTKDNREMPAPLALFFLNGDKQLIPIAIQLKQDIAPNNPVFLCNDEPFLWMVVKMWFNLADASVHQALVRLGFSHFIMEGICTSVYRNLAQNHPLYRLLAPHLLFLLAINAHGLGTQISKEGWIDRTMYIGRKGLFELIRRGISEWRLDVHGNFSKELEVRGVLDQRVLPNYAYRDDAMLFHKAIEIYVKKIVRHYYPTTDHIANDEELQSWAREMATAKNKAGAGLKGIPNDGVLKTHDDIILICTFIIFTCSVQHAATCFGQYEEYGFPPNYPMNLNGEMPMDKLPLKEEEMVAMLPNKGQTMETMCMARVLSARGSKKLGDWDVHYQYDPPALRAEKEFTEDLETISKLLQERSYNRGDIYQYFYLDPEIVPNCITI